MAEPARRDVTGLVLAGGRGSRMGGRDKGLVAWRDRALVDHVLERLRPQVGPIVVSANRHVDDYARRGHVIVGDATDTYDGPLAGVLAGLRAAATPWIAVVPCDAPRLPADLVARLARGASMTGAHATHSGFAEPLFCLLSTHLAAALANYLADGGRKVVAWMAAHDVAPVAFDRDEDADAFVNLNTPEDLGA